ncbi:MAG: DUF4405 domain-containing protein [Dehalococcoidales bacterium]|nr:DUF4405 domain-containing protein [Dehalococcoidales bacterium]
MSIKKGLDNYINYFLDILLLLSIVLTIFSSYIIWFVLPRGTGLHGWQHCQLEGYGGGNIGIAFGLPRYTWVDIHNWAAVALLLIVILHVILHLKWFIQTTKKIVKGFVKPLWQLIEQYIVSIALLILCIFQGISGAVIWLILPRGELDYPAMIIGHGRTFWGLQRNIWVDLHAWIAVIIVSVTIIHLIINWGWVVATSKKICHGIQRPFRKKGDIDVTNQS